MRAEYVNKDKIIKIIEEHIGSIVGYKTLDILNAYLSMSNATIKDVLDKPEQVAKGLDTIFGSSATILKKEIINIIYMEFGIKLTNFDDIKDINKRLR